MCIAPMTISDGTQVACRNCWQCRTARIDDWVGRCIAESKTVAGASAITLTYGRDNSTDSVTYGEAEHERAAVLTYSDVQKYFKRLRRARIREAGKAPYGYPCRYFVTGEYGSAKGRAHWHVIVFWLERVPPHEVGVRFLEEHWPHGVSFWTAPSYEDFRYNCKYILKGMGEAERQGHLSMSKRPLIGAEYFRRMARDYAEQGLAPKDGFYTFPEAVRKNGERVQFRLAGASKALFINAFADAWRDLHGDAPLPFSEWVDDYLDPGAWSGRDERAPLHVYAPDGPINWAHPANQPLPDLGALRRVTGEPDAGADGLRQAGGRRPAVFYEAADAAWFWLGRKGKFQWQKGRVEKTASGKVLFWAVDRGAQTRPGQTLP